MAEVVEKLTMDVPRQALWDTITSFDEYPNFVDEVVKAERLPGGTDARFQVQFELEVVKRFVYVLEFAASSPETLSWKLVESNFFKRNQGAWKLEENGGKTDVVYEVDVEVGFFVPKWVAKKLTAVSLPRMMKAFEERAKQRSE